MNYDVKFPDEQRGEKLPNVWNCQLRSPNPNIKLEFKQRENVHELFRIY